MNSHTIPTFKKLMKIANENNIKVVASLSGYTYDQLLSGAYDTLVEENDDKSEDFSHASGKCIVVTNGRRRHLFEFD